MQGRPEIWKLSLPPVSEPEPGEEPDCCLGFVDWETGTRNFLRHTSKSLMLYHPKECVPISEIANQQMKLKFIFY